MRRKIIIDTDPGIDDAYAIIAALQNQEIEVLGITCVCGNKGLDKTVANALRLTQLLKKDVLVYKGAFTNISSLRANRIDPINADKVHGNDGLGNTNLPYDEHNLSVKSAIDFIIETINMYPYEVEILALGPLTNLALCIEKDEEVMKKTKAIYSMGGGIKRGNITPYAEFNYYYDELATALVFNKLQSTVNINMIGLDATHSTRIDHNDLAFMMYEDDNIGKFIHDITQVYGSLYYNNYGYLGAVIHDVIAYLYMIEPQIAIDVIKDVYIDVKTDQQHRGQTVVDKKIKAKTNVIMKCDRELTCKLTIKALLPDKYNRYLQVIAI